jgi:hypothetical protein
MKSIIKVVAVFFLGIGVFSCKDDDVEVATKERSELIFTELSGEGVEGHGDHFHGLAAAIEGKSTSVTFDKNGTATANGHLHLEAEKIYKIQLKTWNAEGVEIQNDFIANKAVADNYKAFLVGGNFVLNPNSANEEGALFQTREVSYGDGTAVTGQYETTGVTSYFIAGHENEGEKDVTFVLRKLDAGVKAKITRVDWNRNDYNTAFSGENTLELKFEMHLGH